jgi:hypothetical protein
MFVDQTPNNERTGNMKTGSKSPSSTTVLAAAALLVAGLALVVALGGVAIAGNDKGKIVVRSKTVRADSDQVEGNGSYDFVRADRKCKSDETALSASAFFSQPNVNPISGLILADVNELVRNRNGYTAFGASDYATASGKVKFTLQVVCRTD